MHAEAIRFSDSPSRCSLSDQPIPTGGVPRALRFAAEGAGLDPVAELYNEALKFAHEGHLKPAKDRLLMLLTMCPEDGEAALLLGKVQVAGQKWQDALTAICIAEESGTPVDPAFRLTIEENLRADTSADEEDRQNRMAREQGEIKALRQEARRLRSENAQLLGRTSEMEVETRKWAWATAGVSGMAIVFLLANLLFGGGSAPEAPVTVANTPNPTPDAALVVADEQPAEAAGYAVNDAPSTTPTALAERAAGALAADAALDGTTLEVEVSGSNAKLSGVVPTFIHRKRAEAVLTAVHGIDTVGTDGVEINSRTRGSHHIVSSGDNLSKIAYQHYGDASQSKVVLRANKKTLGGRNNLSIGQELVIPAID